MPKSKKPKPKPKLPARLCQQKNRYGKPCGAYAITKSAYCFGHDPSKAAFRLAAARKGGLLSRSVTLPIDVVDPKELNKADKCLDALGDIYWKVESGQLSPNVGKVLIQAVQTALNVQGVVIDDTLARLETLLLNKKIDIERGKGTLCLDAETASDD